MKSPRSSRVSICVALLLMAPLAACGTGDDTATPEATVTTPTTAVVVAGGDTTEVESLVGTPDHDVAVVDGPDAVAPADPERTESHEGEARDAAEQAFESAGYSFEQLEILSRQWNVDLDEARYRAGLIIVSGDLAAFDGVIGAPEQAATSEAHEGEAIDAAMQAWDRSGYSFEQLEILSRQWNVDLDEAQYRAGLIVLSGDLDAFDGVIGAPEQGDAG